MIEIHILLLRVTKHIFILRDIEENSGDGISPVVEKFLLIMGCVHQFMHNVQFEFEFLIIDRVFAWTMKVKLNASCNIVVVYLFFFEFRQSNGC